MSAETLNGYRMLIVFRDSMIWPEGYSDQAFWPGDQTRNPSVHPFHYSESESSGYRTLLPLPVKSQPAVPNYESESVSWMTSNQGKAVKRFLMDGGVALFYHNSTYISRSNGDFREVLGAATLGHPPTRPFRIQITNSNHPITEGVRDFVVTDEQHFLTYDSKPEFVFMRSVNEDGMTYQNAGSSCEAGWAYNYGLGRVCYLAPGHTIMALWNSEYKKLQQNAVRWLLEK